MVDSQSIVNDPGYVPLAVSSSGSAADVVVFRVDEDGTFLIVSSSLPVRRPYGKRGTWLKSVRYVRD